MLAVYWIRDKQLLLTIGREEICLYLGDPTHRVTITTKTDDEMMSVSVTITFLDEEYGEYNYVCHCHDAREVENNQETFQKLVKEITDYFATV